MVILNISGFKWIYALNNWHAMIKNKCYNQGWNFKGWIPLKIVGYNQILKGVLHSKPNFKGMPL